MQDGEKWGGLKLGNTGQSIFTACSRGLLQLYTTISLEIKSTPLHGLKTATFTAEGLKVWRCNLHFVFCRGGRRFAGKWSNRTIENRKCQNNETFLFL